MHKYERDELRRIIKGRFEVLHAQLNQRRAEIGGMLREEIEVQHAAAIKRMDVKASKLNEKYQKLAEEAEDLIKEAAGLGLAPSSYSGLADLRKGVNIKPTDWNVKDKDKLANAATHKIQVEAGAAGLDLRYEELKLYEALAVDSLETPEAQKFFDQIPTVDDVLPLPSAAKVKELA